MKHLQFSDFSHYRRELMGIAIIGVCLLHAFAWTDIEGTKIARIISPFARIAFTEGFLFLSGFGLYYSFCKNNNKRTFYLKRFNRVLLPYVIMCLPFFLRGLIGGVYDFPSVLLKFSTIYFWIFGNDGMWYISLSVVLYLLFPFIFSFMFDIQKEKFVVQRTLTLIALCIAVCLMLYHFIPEYYKLIEIGVAKIPMFFIGMLTAYYAHNGKVLTIWHLFGGDCLKTITAKMSPNISYC